MKTHSVCRTNGVTIFCTSIIILLAGARVDAAVIASDMTGSGSLNLNSFSNPSNGAFASAADGFQKYQRNISGSIPFSLMDDSLTVFPGDTLGIVGEDNTDVFFGATDTENPQNSGSVSATWSFDISGGTDLALSIDMGAMGDFESSDTFVWSYSIDGGASVTAFESAVDEAAANTYTLAGGASITLNDPMTMNGEIINNDFQTFSALISGTGTELTLTLTASTNGGTEAFAFQNIEINTGGLPLQVVAFDMVGSNAQNLSSFTNAFDGAFSSSADGFQKYQRSVSASIPFSVLDDSASIFPGDSLGIIREDNLDVFFGVTDTVNNDNSGDVTASWVFDVSGSTGLGLAIDMGAMGDFESSDSFTWSYSIDGGTSMTAFASTVDEAGANTYTLAGGTVFTLNDPMIVQGTVLTNELAQFTTPLTGTGSQLELTLTASTNGGTEAFVFQNIIIAEGFGPPPPPPVVEIFEIQGSGAQSPFSGDTVESLANVVSAVASDGFFMQTPASRSDGDVDTSDGIFVFTGEAPGVSVGDMVDVLGEVTEFFGFTEFTNGPTVTVQGAGLTPPAPVLLDDMTPSSDPLNPSCAIEFECYESMLVEIVNGSVTGSNQRFNSDIRAEVHITAAPDRTFRETGLEFPGISGLPVWDGNPEVFELDPNRLGLPNQTILAGSTFSAVGVIGFEFGGYEFWPTSLTVTDVALPRAVREKNKKEISVGSLNLFRLFDDIDDAPIANSLGELMNDQVIPTDEYQRRLAKLAAYIVDNMHAPDILAVQEVEKLDTLQDLADAVNALEKKAKYRAYLEEGNDIGSIDVGFLVRKKVKVERVTQLGADETFIETASGRLDLLHDRPPLLLEVEVKGGADLDLFVMVVHNRSLNSITTGRVQEKRLKQAQSIAEMAQAIQVDDDENALVIIGDFNAFEFTDGFVDAIGQISGNANPADNLLSGPDLVEPDLVNQVLSVPANERYSFVFRGNAQSLDHALVSELLVPRVSGLEHARGNADAAVDLINDGTTSLRASDHDGLVLFIDTRKIKDEDDSDSDDSDSDSDSDSDDDDYDREDDYDDD